MTTLALSTSLLSPAEIAGDYAAVLFDLDGTLIDSEASIERAWRAWCNRYGVDRAQLDGLIHGRTATDLVRLVRPTWSQTLVEESARFQLAVQEEDPDPGTAVPGAGDTLAAFTGGRRWAVVTACTARLARHRLASAGLPEPAVLVSAEDVTHGKPSPDPYLHAAGLLAIDPADCLVVEDSPAGVRSGLAAGCTVAAVGYTHGVSDLADASTVVPTLGNLVFAG